MLALCIAAVVGCGSTAPTPKGSLTVTITPADGTTPAVVVSGPNGYQHTISTSQTLAGLTLGNYTIVADSATGPDSVVGTITDTGVVTGSPATVVTGTPATVTVAYFTKDHIGGLWVANWANHTIPELASTQLRTTGTPAPADTLSTTVSGPAGLALDASGNMWESSWTSDSLVMYTAAARSAGGAAAPSTVIVSTALDNANDLAFDAHGNLWVANCSGGNLLEFTPSQQAAGGAQAPAVAVSGGTIASCPYSIAFDTAGNAWIADDDAHHLVEYSAVQLAANGTPIPIDTIGADGGSLLYPDAVVFDASGNLWVANDGQPTIVAYSAAQLAAGGAPAPTVTITLPQNADPFGLAFDKRGTLWISDTKNDVMYGLTSGQLTTGNPTPAVTLTLNWSDMFEPEQPLFDPYSPAVPVLSGARVHSPIAPLARVHPAGQLRRRHPAVQP
jgi:sugar lactone lactonase YvrE